MSLKIDIETPASALPNLNHEYSTALTQVLTVVKNLTDYMPTDFIRMSATSAISSYNLVISTSDDRLWSQLFTNVGPNLDYKMTFSVSSMFSEPEHILIHDLAGELLGLVINFGVTKARFNLT